MRVRALIVAAVAVVALISAGVPALAGKPVPIGAKVVYLGQDRYQFEANIVHRDDTWQHFVDRWEVIGKGGKVIATDYFYYPRIGENIVWHVLRGIRVAPGTTYVIYRLHDSKDGYGRDMLVRMPTPAHPDTGWQH